MHAALLNTFYLYAYYFRDGSRALTSRAKRGEGRKGEKKKIFKKGKGKKKAK